MNDPVDLIECRICGRWLSQLQVHLTRKHDIRCDEYRAQYGADAPLMCQRLLELWVDGIEIRGAEKHKKNRGVCPRCGVSFQRGMGKTRDFCSRKCAFATMSEVRSDPKYVANLIAKTTFGEKRVAYVESMKVAKIERQTRACIVCGKLHTFKIRVKIAAGVCSIACRTVYEASKPLQPVVGKQLLHVLELMRADPSRVWGFAELRTTTGFGPSINSVLGQLTRYGKIERIGRGRYRLMPAGATDARE